MPPVAKTDEDKDPFYCPGCGRRRGYRAQCVGSLEQPHAAIEVVSTDELDGDPENHTAAPASE